MHRNSRRTERKKFRHTQKPKEAWQKILYGNQDYPDNYNDPSFLKDLRKNINIKIFKYPEAVLGATKFTHQLSVIVVFLLIFHNLYISPSYIPAEILLLLVALICLIGYVLYTVRNGPRQQNDGPANYQATMREDVEPAVRVLFFSFILSPMFYTFTVSFSSDSVYITTFVLFLVHIVCHDYGMQSDIVSRAKSMTSAIFATICLSSRLDTSFDAFVLIIASFILFAIYPDALRLLESNHNLIVKLALVTVFVTASCIALFFISPILLCIYSVIVIICSLICPYIFCYEQKHKNNIYGPWDEAVVETKVDKKVL